MSVGETIADRYLLEEEIGQGGMATVYRATDTRLHREVAIKILHPFLASKSDSAERFLRESQAIARLHHPNIIEIFDASQDASTQTQFIVMELVEGKTLQAFISEHPTHIPEMGLVMTACLCDALEHAHQSNVIHRDIKPENIMFTSDGTIKLMDFGIARILDSERLTLSGCLLGSPAHMAPEIINGEPYSFTCDIFALGTVMYYAMTNELPYTASTPAAVFNAILKMDYVLPSRRNLAISRECDRMIKKCLECKPSDRFGSAKLLKEAIVAELKKAGLEDYVTHLKQYYQAPEEYEKQILPMLLERYNALAQTYYEQKHVPAAIEVLNRILVFDQDNEKARELLVQIRTAYKTIRYIIAAVVVLFLILLGVGGVFLFQGEDEPGETPETSQASNPLAEAPQSPSKLLSRLSFWPLLFPKDESPTSASETPDSTGEQPDAVTPSEADAAVGDVPSNPEKTPDDAKSATPAQPHVQHRFPPGARPGVFRGRKPGESRTKTKTDENATPSGTPENTTANNQKQDAKDDPTATPVELIEMKQPVFPYEAYAFIKGTTESGQTYSGKSFYPNKMGYIELKLPPGKYSMTLSCDTICVPVTKTLVVKASDQGKTLESIVVDFADASLRIKPIDGEKFYYLAIIKGKEKNPPIHIEPNTLTRFGEFGRYQNRQTLTLFRIPRNAVLPNYNLDTLNKYEKLKVELSAGEKKIIQF